VGAAAELNDAWRSPLRGFVTTPSAVFALAATASRPKTPNSTLPNERFIAVDITMERMNPLAPAADPCTARITPHRPVGMQRNPGRRLSAQGPGRWPLRNPNPDTVVPYLTSRGRSRPVARKPVLNTCRHLVAVVVGGDDVPRVGEPMLRLLTRANCRKVALCCVFSDPIIVL
jgi:hypothetical protein